MDNNGFHIDSPRANTAKVGNRPPRGRSPPPSPDRSTGVMTTPTSVQAMITYRETQRQMYQELDAVKALMHAHEVTAKAEGFNWGHVGDLTEVLHLLQRLTRPQA